MAKAKNDMLQKLGLDRDELRILHTKLKHYRYINEVPELRFGSYIRWISLKSPDNIKLVRGAMVCDIKVIEDVIHVVCKNAMNRYFQICMSDNLIFQKLSEQEEVLLSVMDYLND
jgi:hypothetical protein